MVAMGIAKNMLKTGLMFGAIGVILACAAPYIGVGLGLVESVAAANTVLGSFTSTAAYTGAFFGGFGALSVALQPAFDFVFGGHSQPAMAAPMAFKGKVLVPGVAPTIAMDEAPEQTQQAETQPPSTKYRDAILAEKAALAAAREQGKAPTIH